MRVYPPYLILGFKIGDDPRRIHFAARCGKGEHRHDRKTRGDFSLARGQIPRIAVVKGARADKFRRVDDGPAAHGEDRVYLLLFAKRCALSHRVYAGIGLDAAEFETLQARLAKFGDHPIVKPRLFDGPAAVDEQHLLPNAFSSSPKWQS